MQLQARFDLPSPSRRVLLELRPFLYAFGNTPARNLLENLPTDKPYEVRGGATSERLLQFGGWV